ncbi:MAG TPA: response regulator [Thermoanaerobaculia bacterium]|nr:response regulator [Thermoanaerobaculia bacterium]
MIDDEPAIRGLVARIVERAGLEVDTARDGAEAIAMLDEADYAVVVVDLMMPRVDGYEVIEQIRQTTRPKPAVIVATAADAPTLRLLDGTVVHSIVRKPFEIDVLGDLITAAAEMVRREREKERQVLPFDRKRGG